MRRYTENFIKKVREFRRREKMSFKELGRRFNIPANTIRNWCGELVGTRWDAIIIRNEKRREEIKRTDIFTVPDVSRLNKSEAKFLAGILYGCEGSKYPAQRGVAFANSEPGLVVTFLRLLRIAFDINEEKFSVHLQIHTHHDFASLRKEWSKLLSISESNFIKPTVTKPRGKKHRDNYIGTCTLRYWDYRVQLKLLGIYEEFIKRWH